MRKLVLAVCFLASSAFADGVIDASPRVPLVLPTDKGECLEADPTMCVDRRFFTPYQQKIEDAETTLRRIRTMPLAVTGSDSWLSNEKVVPTSGATGCLQWTGTAFTNLAVATDSRVAAIEAAVAALQGGQYPVQPPTCTGLFPSSSGPVGTSVTVSGTNLNTASSVKFNGTAATFSIVSSSAVSAVVPVGANTGTITVTASGGTSTCPSFTVTAGTAALPDTVYASASGTGTACTPDAPCSLAQAVTNARTHNPASASGTTVSLAAGTYALSSTLTLTAADSGTASKPITYKCASGTCLVTGGQAVSGWTLMTSGNAPTGVWARLPAEAQGNTYFAQVSGVSLGSIQQRGDNWGGRLVPLNPGPVAELVYGGAPMQLGRYPNLNADDKLEWMTLASAGTVNTTAHTATVPYSGTVPERWDTAIALNDANKPYLSMFECESWVWGLRMITARTTGVLTTTSKANRYDESGLNVNGTADPTNLDGCSGAIGSGQQFFATNLLEELDSAGEYWIDRDPNQGFVYFWPPDANIATTPAFVSAIPTVLQLSGVSYVTFDGITFGESQGDLVKADASTQRVTIKNATLRNAGGNLARLDGTANVITDSTLTGAGDAGVILLGTGHTVANSAITKVGRLSLAAAGAINVGGSAHTIASNDISDMPWDAVFFATAPSTGDNTLVEKNDISSVDLFGCDNGAIYLNRNGTGVEIRYNFIHGMRECIGPNPYTGVGAGGIYSDDLASGVLIHGNLFYKLGAQTAGGGNGTISRTTSLFTKGTNTVRNNLFVKNDYAIQTQTTCPTTAGNVHYLSDNGGANQTGLALHSGCSVTLPSANPNFANEGTGDLSNAAGGYIEMSGFTTPPTGTKAGTIYTAGDGKERIPFSQIGKP